jgi:hypothetical protein
MLISGHMFGKPPLIMKKDWIAFTLRIIFESHGKQDRQGEENHTGNGCVKRMCCFSLVRMMYCRITFMIKYVLSSRTTSTFLFSSLQSEACENNQNLNTEIPWSQAIEASVCKDCTSTKP